MTRRYARLNVNLNEDTAAALKRLARTRDISVTETIRRAVALMKFVEDEMAAGCHVQVVDSSGSVRELVFLPDAK